MVNEKRIQQLLRLSYILLILLVLFLIMKLSPLWVLILQVLFRVFAPFIIAVIISYLLHPIVETLHAFGIKRTYAVTMIFLLFFLGVGIIAVLGAPYVYKQIRAMFEQLPFWMQKINQWTNIFNERMTSLPLGLQTRFNDWLFNVEQFAENGAEKLGQWLIHFFQSLIYFIIIPFLVFYFLKDYKLMEKVIWYFTPREWRKKGYALLKDIDVTLGNFIRGQVIVSLFAGILSAIALALIGVNYALILGLFIGVTNIIPYFGPIIGIIPAALVALFESWQKSLLTIIVLLIVQQIEGNILSPIIVGKTLQLHPVLIMFALLFGVEIGGIVGLILAVPLLAILKVIILHIRKNIHEQWGDR